MGCREMINQEVSAPKSKKLCTRRCDHQPKRIKKAFHIPKKSVCHTKKLHSRDFALLRKKTMLHFVGETRIPYGESKIRDTTGVVANRENES